MKPRVLRPVIFSKLNLSNPRNRKYVEYGLGWVRGALPGGEFSKRTRLLRLIPGKPLAFIMNRLLKYDGLFLERGGKIVGNVFFQRHGNTLHVFGVYIEPSLRMKGLAMEALEHFIEHARTVEGIRMVRIGGGRDPRVTRALGLLKRYEEKFGIRVKEAGWIELT